MKLSAFFLTTGALSQDEGSGQNSGESNTDSTLSFTTNPKAGFLIFDWLQRSRWFHVRANRRASKVGCVFPRVIVSIPPRAEFGPNGRREGASHLSKNYLKYSLYALIGITVGKQLLENLFIGHVIVVERVFSRTMTVPVCGVQMFKIIDLEDLN